MIKILRPTNKQLEDTRFLMSAIREKWKNELGCKLAQYEMVDKLFSIFPEVKWEIVCKDSSPNAIVRLDKFYPIILVCLAEWFANLELETFEEAANRSNEFYLQENQ